MTVPAQEQVDGLAWPIVSALADCLCAELERSPGGSPCFCGVVPGQIVPMDFCDCLSGNRCGMGWVRLDSGFPSTRFPQQDTTAQCRTPLAVQIQVGVTRCVPGLDPQGNPPDAVAQAEAVRVQMGDMDAVRRAVACCSALGTYTMGRYQPLGPLGNCAGGYWLLQVQV